MANHGYRPTPGTLSSPPPYGSGYGAAARGQHPLPNSGAMPPTRGAVAGEQSSLHQAVIPPDHDPHNSTKLRFMHWALYSLLPMCVCFVVPWVFFVVIYALLAFSWHYNNPFLCWSLVVCGVILVLACGFKVFMSFRNRSDGDPNEMFYWEVFLYVTMFLALVVGCTLGYCNYRAYMYKYYDLAQLNSYSGVDPLSDGRAYMDAGHIDFTDGARLDQTKSVGFRNADMFCVAPIVSTGLPASYDFWATGTNCCSGNSADFHCGEFDNPLARGGLRVMRADERPFFRLAVKEAEVTYGIHAGTPIFLQWVQNPGQVLSSYRDRGVTNFIFWIFAYLVLQLLYVLIAKATISGAGKGKWG